MVPWRLRHALRKMLVAPARRAYARALAAIPHHPSPPGAIVLHLGDFDGRWVHGGRVKTLHLGTAFKVDPAGANVLYLVSSSPPKFADLLVKWARGRGMRFVWNQNGVGYPAWAGSEHEAINQPMRALLQSADRVIYQSRFCQVSADRFLGVFAGPSEILPNPVDVEAFHPATVPPAPVPLRLLTIGTHATPDRVLGPIEAVHLLRADGADVRLTVAGPLAWPGASAFEPPAGLPPGVVRFIPGFSQADAPSIYREHHVVLHPKTMDPCPTVVLEALASGLPVIGSASGGMPELVDASCGVLFSSVCDYNSHVPVPAEDLARGVRIVCADLARFSGAARARAVGQFGLPGWIERHREIFQEEVAGQ